MTYTDHMQSAVRIAHLYPRLPYLRDEDVSHARRELAKAIQWLREHDLYILDKRVERKQ